MDANEALSGANRRASCFTAVQLCCGSSPSMAEFRRRKKFSAKTFWACRMRFGARSANQARPHSNLRIMGKTSLFQCFGRISGPTCQSSGRTRGDEEGYPVWGKRSHDALSIKSSLTATFPPLERVNNSWSGVHKPRWRYPLISHLSEVFGKRVRPDRPEGWEPPPDERTFVS